MKVLATGATGTYAGLVVSALVRQGVDVRAVVHDPAKRDIPLGHGAGETVTADLRDPASLRAAAGRPTAARTVRRMRGRYGAEGLWGLVDRRHDRPAGPHGRVDERVIAAARTAIGRETPRSTGTKARLWRTVQADLVAEHGEGVVPLPSIRTFERLVDALVVGLHTFGPATARRTQANRPAAPFGVTVAGRPGELVQIDTTPLDVMAVLDDGVVGRVELTIALDLATRSICAAVLRPHGTKAVDASLLLALMLVPEPMRPGCLRST
ncbi:NmrA family NAD(P)-binding protein [Parafrankia sp. FMc6]|uniref:NmrA family NAD(P)-binding protein n=1 Tax=Parafrankia soli TaxID=2599596 RepID=UPI0034D684BF